ncbi:MAG: hypothetical protein IJS37_03040 [Bacilli bacterium]|nr:hypothetical protein [Bacilli bacterium]
MPMDDSSRVLTLAQIEELTLRLFETKITYGELLARYEKVAYPNGDAKHSEKQEIALKLYRNVRADEADVRRAFTMLSERGRTYEEALAMLEG